MGTIGHQRRFRAPVPNGVTCPQNAETPAGAGVSSSGASRARTDDLLHAMQALSQLSYSPWDGG